MDIWSFSQFREKKKAIYVQLQLALYVAQSPIIKIVDENRTNTNQNPKQECKEAYSIMKTAARDLIMTQYS